MIEGFYIVFLMRSREVFMVEVMFMCTHTLTHTLTPKQSLIQMEIGRTGILTRGITA